MPSMNKLEFSSIIDVSHGFLAVVYSTALAIIGFTYRNKCWLCDRHRERLYDIVDFPTDDKRQLFGRTLYFVQY
jgi:hypothetical protein